MSDTTVKLGDFEFDHLEVPSQINAGGSQDIALHKLVGGQRVANAMGESSSDITFSGIFLGFSATERAKYLDGLRKAGKPLSFTYFNFVYTVLIKSFTFDVQRFYQIPYSITLLVVEDKSTPINFIVPTGFGDVVIDAIQEALDIATAIRNPSLTNAIGLLNLAINQIPDFSTAGQAALNNVLAPLSTAQSNVGTLINTISSGLFK